MMLLWSCCAKEEEPAPDVEAVMGGNVMDAPVLIAGGEALTLVKVMRERPSDMSDEATTASSTEEPEGKKSHPVVAPHLFCASLEKPENEKLVGVILDMSDGETLQVSRLPVDEESPLSQWNERMPKERRIRAGDYIVQVNEVNGDASAMMKEIQASPCLMLYMRPAHKFQVRLKRSHNSSMGLDLRYHSRGRSLVIKEIMPGCVADWNRAHPEAAVEVNDRIVAAEGISGYPRELVDKITNAGSTLTLQVSRPGRTAPEPSA